MYTTQPEAAHDAPHTRRVVYPDPSIAVPRQKILAAVFIKSNAAHAARWACLDGYLEDRIA